jgi:NTE family protein
LEEDGFRPDFIVGTSAGAIAGAAYACVPEAAELRERAMQSIARGPLLRLEQQFKKLTEPMGHGFGARVRERIRQAKRLLLYNRQAMKHSLLSNRVLRQLAHGMVGDADFADLSLPFYAVACDLTTNQRVVFGAGNVASALMASGAIPGIFEPLLDGESVLVDGCALDVLPCEVARLLGAHVVIAVDIGHPPPKLPPRNAADILKRVSDLRSERLRQDNRHVADVVISPNVASIEWMEVSRSQQAYEAGYAAARHHAEDVRRAIGRARWQSLLQRWLRRNPNQAAAIPIASLPPRPEDEREELLGEEE